MKKIIALLLCLLVFGKVFSCEVKYITSFGGCSSEHRIKDECDVVRKEVSKITFLLDRDKDVVCLDKVEENGSLIMTYDDAGVMKQIIFKKCNKNNIRNDLYIFSKTVLYKEVEIF